MAGLLLSVLAVLTQALLPALHALACATKPVKLVEHAPHADDHDDDHAHDHAPHGGPAHFDPADSSGHGSGTGCLVCDALAQLPVAIDLGGSVLVAFSDPTDGARVPEGSSAQGRRAAPPSARAPPQA